MDITDVMRELATTRALSEELASSGQRHDNGFDKIVMATSSISGMKVVLHIWQGSGEDGMDNIHDHRWDFASVVLRGELQTEIYRSASDGESYQAFSYQSPSGGATYRFEPTGAIAVTRVALLRLARTSTYLWDHQILHRAFGVGAARTATLIVQGRPRQNSTTVLLRGERTPLPDHRVTRLDAADTRDRLLRLAADSAVLSAWQGR